MTFTDTKKNKPHNSHRQSAEKNLYNKNLLHLAEMLKLLKQGDNKSNRETVKTHCQELLELGKKVNFFGYVELLETAKQAIIERTNPYETTLKLIIKEIKEAGDKILNGHSDQIYVSSELEELAPNTREELMNFETICEMPLEEIAKAKEATIERDLWAETQSNFGDKKQTKVNDDWEEETTNYDSFAETLITKKSYPDSTKEKREKSTDSEHETLDNWFDDDYFEEEKEEKTGAFMREENPLTSTNYPDSLDDISRLFGEEEEENNQQDDWSFISHIDIEEKEETEENTFNNPLEEEEQTEEDDWDLLLDIDSDIPEKSVEDNPTESPESKQQDMGDDFLNLFEEFDSLDDFETQVREPQEETTGTSDDFSVDDLFDESDDFLADLNFETELVESPSQLVQPLDTLEQQVIKTEPTEQNISPEKIIIYDSFENLEKLIDSPSEFSLDTSFISEMFFLENLIVYYDQFEDIPGLINQENQQRVKCDWSHLESSLGDQIIPETKVEPRPSKTQTPSPTSPLSEMDQLLVQAQKSSTQNKRPAKATTTSVGRQATRKPQVFEQSMRVPVKQLDNLNNMIGEIVVRRNRLEEDQDRLRQFLDNLLSHVQNLSEVGARMQDLYEKSLLEGALLATREKNQATVKAQLERGTYHQDYTATVHSDEAITKTGKSTSTEHHDLDVLDLDRFTGFHLLSQDIIELIVRVRESTSDIQFLVDETDQLGRNLRQVTTQLQEEINKARMVPFSQTTDRLVRPVRDIAMSYDKQVELRAEGKEVLIDKMILEHIWDPIQQIVKNSITHGIEVPAVRDAMGKPITGVITVRAFIQGPQIVISISDDGAGINANKVKQKAIENNLLTPAQAQNIGIQDVYEFLFHPGFTTKDKADSHAGRGVGLDIVRSKLNEVRGAVSIDSTLGRGTTFTIRLPLTLSIGKALCCLNDNARIAFPMDGIEDTQDYSPSDVQVNAQGQKCVRWRNTLLPFRPLSTLLSYNRQLGRSVIYSSKHEEDTFPILILRGGNNLLAIQVDQVIGQEEIVIKQICGPLPKPKGIAGATVRSDGSVMPIADVIELIDIAQGNISKEVKIDMFADSAKVTMMEDPVSAQPIVLIVDDSITVREMLSISLNKAGFRIEQARDGQEAWQKLRSGFPCNLVFCDIEMPRMNGLELLKNMQEDENLCDIPVAILSSRGADKHKQIAADLGASAYLVKPYVEKDLLDSASRMAKGEVLLQGSTKAPKPKAVEVTKQTATSKKATSTSANTTPKVLIIDDSVVVREMLSMTFKKAGYQVEQARDGQDAWEKVSSGMAFDVILCDIEMPRMNGLELLAKIQQDEQLSSLPIAMVTSRGAEKHRKIAAELGARAYFTKPYLEDELLAATKRLIQGEVLLTV
jgi:chemosensory pili system protein ChpA (sensor histidine kinase/response regulator)